MDSSGGKTWRLLPDNVKRKRFALRRIEIRI